MDITEIGPRYRLTAAQLSEWELQTGYEWCRQASDDIVRLPNRNPGTLLRVAGTLAQLEHAPAKVPHSLRRRYLHFFAWAAEQVGHFAAAARLQSTLGNRTEAQWLAYQAGVARELEPLLPRKATVRALQLWEPKKRLWAALSFEKWTPTLLVVQKAPSGWRVLDRQAIGERAQNAHIVVKSGELLLVEQEEGSSRQPEDITCFRLVKGKLKQTFTETGDHGIGIVRRHGRWNILVSRHEGRDLVYTKGAHGWHAVEVPPLPARL